MTFLVVNPLNQQNPFVCSVDLLKSILCSQLSHQVGKSLPGDETQWRNYLGGALQHFLVSLVTYAGTGYGLHSETNGIIFKQIPPIDIPDEQSFDLVPICGLNDFDRSLVAEEIVRLNKIKLPTASACGLLVESPGDPVLRIERPNEYRLDLRVHSLMKAPKGQVPRGYKVLPPIDQSQLETIYYEIRLDLTASRADPSFAADDYVYWSEKLFENIRGKFYEPIEPPEISFGSQ